MSKRLERLSSELARVAAQVRETLELNQAHGVAVLPIRPGRVRTLARRWKSALTGRCAPAVRVITPPGPEELTLRAKEKQEALEALQREIGDCCRCGVGANRTHLVFGDGNPDADLMFVGEAPGREEDQQGVPFVGRAGQLLTRIIQAIGLERRSVYIANVLKCRPPNNRTPLPDETAACLPFLLRQIEIIRPAIIVALGNPATKALLQAKQGIMKMRGRFVSWNGIDVMPTYHPAYLLRNPAARRDVWDDMRKVHARMTELGLPIGELKKSRRGG